MGLPDNFNDAAHARRFPSSYGSNSLTHIGESIKELEFEENRLQAALLKVQDELGELYIERRMAEDSVL